MRSVTRIQLFRVRLAVVCLAIYWVTLFTLTHLPGVAVPDLNVSDKVKHFAAFFGLTLLLCYVSDARSLWRRFTRVGVIVLLYACVDEFTQGFIPGRTPDLWDLAADAAGMAVAILVYLAARSVLQWYRQMKRSRDRRDESGRPDSTAAVEHAAAAVLH